MKTKYLILIVSLFLFLSHSTNAQDLDGIYLIVKAEDYVHRAESTSKIVRSSYYNQENYRDTVKIFEGYLSNPYTDSKNKKIIEFWHFYRIMPKAHEASISPQDQHKTFLKDSSFLNTVDCIYWDDIKDLSFGDAKDYIGTLLFNKTADGRWVRKTIYVIDLAENHPKGRIKLYQVKDMRKEWFRTIFIDNDDKQNWEKNVKAVREKVDKRREQRKDKPFKN